MKDLCRFFPHDVSMKMTTLLNCAKNLRNWRQFGNIRERVQFFMGRYNVAMPATN